MARFIDSYSDCHVEVAGKWYIARPLRLDGIMGIIGRIKDAWLVIIDKADAVTFKEDI